MVVGIESVSEGVSGLVDDIQEPMVVFLISTIDSFIVSGICELTPPFLVGATCGFSIKMFLSLIVSLMLDEAVGWVAFSIKFAIMLLK